MVSLYHGQVRHWCINFQANRLAVFEQALCDVDGYASNNRSRESRADVFPGLFVGRPVTFRANDYTTLLPDVSVVRFLCLHSCVTGIHAIQISGRRIRDVAAVPNRRVRFELPSTPREDPRVFPQTSRTL